MNVLFGYPIAATQNNWFHECLCQAVRTIHSLKDANKGYPAWPRILPAEHRAALKDRPKLRELVAAYNVAVRSLTKDKRDAVLLALESENRIPELLSGAATCARKNDLPQSVQSPVAQLFTYAFDVLGELDLRTPHYRAIYDQIPARVCPFCGINIFDAPGGPQEPLDHYLTRVIYPFAAANLRNLVPMCHKCNSSYKKTADLVRRADLSARVAFDPYNFTTQIGVYVDASRPFISGADDAQLWNVEIVPASPEVSTWDEVFSVRERYRRDHFKPWYKSWVDMFVKSARLTMGPYSDQRLIEMLRSHEEGLRDEGLGDRAFLKAAVFRMLRLHCEAGYQEALDHLREWIWPPAA